jgi:hypothetical protein
MTNTKIKFIVVIGVTDNTIKDIEMKNVREPLSFFFSHLVNLFFNLGI